MCNFKYSIIIVKFIILLNVINIQCLIEHDEINTKRAHYVDGKIGAHVIFNCPLEFPHETPIPYILHWNKDGRKIFTWHDGQLTTSDLYVGRVNLLESSIGYGRASVNLTSIRESDAGWYECRVMFPNRTPSVRNNGTWFLLSIDGTSLIKIPPVNQTILEGKTAFLNCVMKYPDNSFTQWYKDGAPIEELHDLNHRSYMAPDGSLSIDPTIMSDIGNYVCVVRNSDEEQQSAQAYLNVQYKAKVIYVPHEVYLPIGKPATLDCHFRSNPPLTSIRWEKDGFLYDPYNVQGVFFNLNGSLLFSSVDEIHAGRYSCIPYNSLGTDGPSPIINVIVQRPPVFTNRPKQLYMVKLNQRAVLECDATDSDGSHRPVIQWKKKDGTALPFSRVSFEGSNLTIDQVNETDRGIYQCTATNEAATITADTELLIENVAPHPPYNLSANSSDSAITLRWQPGYLRKYLEYIIWYRLSNTAEWRTLRLPTSNQMQATITRLEPAHEYEFMVLSQDAYGDGMFSKAYRYFTKPRNFTDVPAEYKEAIHGFAQIGPPRNLTIEEAEDEDGYLVTWLPPDYGIDSLRVYVIRWYREPGHFLHGTAETRRNYYIVKHLAENEVYTIQVSSLSSTDYQAGSEEVELLVPAHKRMKAIAIGTTAALLFLLTTVSVFIYIKTKCSPTAYKQNNDKI